MRRQDASAGEQNVVSLCRLYRGKRANFEGRVRELVDSFYSNGKNGRPECIRTNDLCRVTYHRKERRALRLCRAHFHSFHGYKSLLGMWANCGSPPGAPTQQTAGPNVWDRVRSQFLEPLDLWLPPWFVLPLPHFHCPGILLNPAILRIQT